MSDVVMNGGICAPTEPIQQVMTGTTPPLALPAANRQRTRVAVVAIVLALFVCWSWCRRRQLMRPVLEPAQPSLRAPLDPEFGVLARRGNAWDDDPLFQPF